MIPVDQHNTDICAVVRVINNVYISTHKAVLPIELNSIHYPGVFTGEIHIYKQVNLGIRLVGFDCGYQSPFVIT
jgi:hypothetical protein